MIAVEKPPLAFKVAETGFSLAKALDAEAILVHVNASALLYTSDSGMSVAQIEDHVVQTAEKLLNELIELYAKDMNPLSFVLEGNTEHEILNTMKDIKPDLLVLGTHSRNPWQELLLGSVSENIIRHSICPVMLVRESETK